jgi:DNA mismatch repair protein MutS
MMRQYLAFKERHPDHLLLMRMGDFYESFGDDARVVAETLDIALTTRDKGQPDAVPLAGIPHHALGSYLPRLLAAGHHVALAEQLVDGDPLAGTSSPAVSSGTQRKKRGGHLVEREIVRLYSPGTLYEEELLPGAVSSYLAALVEGRNGYGIALAELSTGELLLAEFTGSDAREPALAELARRGPREILLPESAVHLRDGLPPEAGVTRRSDTDFSPGAVRRLREHYGVTTLEGFGVGGYELAQRAAAAVTGYLEETQLGGPLNLRPPKPLERGVLLRLDRATVDTLELVSSAADRASSRRSLLELLDQTLTPMGRRLLRRWLVAPLVCLEPIIERQAAVADLVDDADARSALREGLRGTGDLERAAGRTALRRAAPRDLVLIREALRRVPHLVEWLRGRGEEAWRGLGEGLEELPGAAELLAAALVEEPGRLGSGRVIAPGWDADFDRAVGELEEAERWIRGLQKTERERTGIGNLKVGFNKVFGYFLEVPRSKADRVPEDYRRKQTLVAAERYVTPELKEKEAVVTRGRERLTGLEANLYRRLTEELNRWGLELGGLAGALARLDVLASLAETAARGGWCRPELDASRDLELVGGRHPLVERHGADPFVPNDCRLSAETRQIMLLTGPNMAGKSTYLRQVGLAVILAQMGSFVPASSLRLGLVDAVFTRVGAADDIARGLSTFMVEMTETARIVNCATPRSLLLLDEVGRGTSTTDGVAIAWAVAEHLHDSGGLAARTIFATHYHELTRLVEVLPRAFNMQMAVLDRAGEVRFLHRVEEGAARSSYGVHVARLAGLPKGIIRRARALLKELEGGRVGTPTAQMALTAAEPDDAEPDYGWLAAELRGVKPETITPLAALNLLAQWRGRLIGGQTEED